MLSLAAVLILRQLADRSCEKWIVGHDGILARCTSVPLGRGEIDDRIVDIIDDKGRSSFHRRSCCRLGLLLCEWSEG